MRSSLLVAHRLDLTIQSWRWVCQRNAVRTSIMLRVCHLSLRHQKVLLICNQSIHCLLSLLDNDKSLDLFLLLLESKTLGSQGTYVWLSCLLYEEMWREQLDLLIVLLVK